MPGILIVAEHRRGELRAASLEAIAAAARIKDGAGGPVTVLVIAADPARYAAQLAVGVADEVLAVTVANDEFEPHVSQAVVHRRVAPRQHRTKQALAALHGAASVIFSLVLSPAVTAKKDRSRAPISNTR